MWEKNKFFVFEQRLIILVWVDIATKFENKRNAFCSLLTACKILNKSDKRLLRYYMFIFSMSCRIASVTSYLSENEAKNLQNGDVHVAQIPDFEVGYLENHLAHWGQWQLIFFFIFRAFSFELNFFSTGVSL